MTNPGSLSWSLSANRAASAPPKSSTPHSSTARVLTLANRLPALAMRSVSATEPAHFEISALVAKVRRRSLYGGSRDLANAAYSRGDAAYDEPLGGTNVLDLHCRIPAQEITTTSTKLARAWRRAGDSACTRRQKVRSDHVPPVRCRQKCRPSQRGRRANGPRS